MLPICSAWLYQGVLYSIKLYLELLGCTDRSPAVVRRCQIGVK